MGDPDPESFGVRWVMSLPSWSDGMAGSSVAIGPSFSVGYSYVEVGEAEGVSVTDTVVAASRYAGVVEAVDKVEEVCTVLLDVDEELEETVPLPRG